MTERKMIYLDDAINALERNKDKKAKGDIGGFYNKIIQNDIDSLRQLPSAQPETAKRIVGKSRNGMTLWYQCEICNEPIDEQDTFCSRCGRRLVSE